jgi:hypothetical protein
MILPASNGSILEALSDAKLSALRMIVALCPNP